MREMRHHLPHPKRAQSVISNRILAQYKTLTLQYIEVFFLFSYAMITIGNANDF